MIAMRALRTFRGRPDEGLNGKVRHGREFRTGDDRRALDLERAGLAIRVISPPEQSAPPLVNEVADHGPLSIAGGKIGGTKLPSLSRADQARQTAISDQPEEEQESSASTNRGASRRGRTRSTGATERGGNPEDPERSLLD